MQIPPLWSLFFTAISLLAGLITFGMEHPRKQYLKSIPDVKNDRLAEVNNALGPIVSDVIEFMEQGDDGSAEDLTETDQATVALAESLSPSDDLPDVKEAIKNFYFPERVFKWCRRSHDACYVFFVSGVVLGIIPAAAETSVADDKIPGIASAVSYWGAAGATILGVVVFLVFLWLRSRLDNMTEAADFKLS